MFINGLPTYSKEGKKLQTGLIVGRVESHDYEGKTYNDLVADYVCVSASTAGQAPAPTDNFAEIEDDGELPF